MKLFQCGNCTNPVFFENDSCEKCGFLLGYLDSAFDLIALKPEFKEWTVVAGASYKYCKNHEFKVCNWLVPKSDESGFCHACDLNRTIPNLNDKKTLKKWQRLEVAKHRLIFQLQRLRLPIQSKLTHSDTGFCFDFLKKKDLDELQKNLMTGHANGVITIMLSEADNVLREAMKRQMSERYRTLLGHFRHEVGHYFWERLIQDDSSLLMEFRTIFGDERESYTEALQRHYKEGPKKKWRSRYISKYASSHPWEDWAETWAHYLHIMDTMETAYYFGLAVDPELDKKVYMKMDATFNPYEEKKFKRIVESCIPLFFALNSINRSMGVADVYPFVISKPVIRKMKFVHQMLFTAAN